MTIPLSTRIAIAITVCFLCVSCGGDMRTARIWHMEGATYPQIEVATGPSNKPVIRPVGIRCVSDDGIVVVDVLAIVGEIAGSGSSEDQVLEAIYNRLSVWWMGDGKGMEIISESPGKRLSLQPLELTQSEAARQGVGHLIKDHPQYSVSSGSTPDYVAAILPITAKVPGIRVGEHVRIRLIDMPSMFGAKPDSGWTSVIVSRFQSR